MLLGNQYICDLSCTTKSIFGKLVKLVDTAVAIFQSILQHPYVVCGVESCSIFMSVTILQCTHVIVVCYGRDDKQPI